jgi:SAM-dependent methyltransferase
MGQAEAQMTWSRDWMPANRRNWDERAAIHAQNRTGFYPIDRLKAGEDILQPIEAAEIGDVAGKRLIHLQCHIGLDTLCLARRGAIVTGLDFSPTAIAAALALASELGIPAEFVESDVFGARERLSGSFDVAFVTWGTICWLPNIERWAQVVASLLAAGGVLYLADAHPSALVLEEIEGRILPHYPWRVSADKPLIFEDAQTYTGDATELVEKRNYEWIHPLSAIITGLIEAGLQLEFLHEHERLPWKLFASMEPDGDRMFRLPETAVPIPLSFSLMARNPE